MSVKDSTGIDLPLKRDWSKYLSTGSLLGDGLDIVGSFGRFLSSGFGVHKGQEQDNIYETPPIDVLEQDLILNVTTRSSSKRAAKLMLARLSPLPETQIEWDIVGPHSAEDIELDGKADDKQFKNTKSKFTLGIVRKIDLEHWDGQQVGNRSLKIMGRQGGVYKFTSSFNRQRKRKQTLLLILVFIGCYFGLLWGAAQWANRPTQITDKWQDQARTIRLSNQDIHTELERTQARIVLGEQFNENMRGVNILDIFADMSKTMPDNGWIREMNLSGHQIRLSGTTDNPAKLATQMEAKPYIKQVQLGAVSADRSTNLQQFTLTIILTEKTP